MRILTIIVTFYPNKDKLIKNIQAIEPYVDRILLWENTPGHDAEKYRFYHSDKIMYCGNKENDGIPIALNFAWNYAVLNGYDFVLTMDQDSCWHNFGLFLETAIKLSKSKKNCIWGPFVNDEGKECKGLLLPRRRIITSGMLVSTTILNKVNGWPITFKIDLVDDDFCYNCHKYGIKFFEINKGFLEQNYGIPLKKKVWIFGKEKRMTTYPPARLYYILRNGIIMGKKYSDFPTLYFIKCWFFVRLVKVILYEDNKFNKIKSIINGFISGIKFKIENK
jgi:rhamnosyltransferase